MMKLQICCDFSGVRIRTAGTYSVRIWQIKRKLVETSECHALHIARIRSTYALYDLVHVNCFYDTAL